MRRSATYNSLAKDGQASDFIAMIEQDEYSYVKLAGYYALNERFPEKTFEGALRLFATAGRPGFALYAPAVEPFEDVPNDAEHRAVLHILEEAPENRTENVDLLTSRLPYKMLFDWFHEKQGMIKEPARVFVLARLYEDGRTRAIAPTELMAKYLTQCWDYPGRARYVYLYYADSKDDDYLARLQTFLSDESESEIVLKRLVAFRQNDITESVDIENLKVSVQRRKLIREALSVTPTN